MDRENWAAIGLGVLSFCFKETFEFYFPIGNFLRSFNILLSSHFVRVQSSGASDPCSVIYYFCSMITNWVGMVRNNGRLIKFNRHNFAHKGMATI